MLALSFISCGKGGRTTDVGLVVEGICKRDLVARTLDFGHMDSLPASAADQLWVLTGVSRQYWKTNK